MNSKNKIKVLVVDDDKGLLELFKEGLEDLSFDVLTAENGLEAKKLLASNKDIDGIVTDITMPEMNGVELVTYLRGEDNQIPVFFITGYQDYSREVLNSFRPKAVIFKPFDIEEASLLIKNHFLRMS
ncbi:response regulator [Bacteriovorax sp. PP10]|uniref:Response regulator n=1 Tax=Bacteriovorax antarcticus TaxID=3088717 RepID=A0ABU5VWV8_9BACT|nr:response regulator [Bacteriovorax sp. PP10]MEA9357547.1 response regulator [Bacteriovorax sp. PP10]